MNENLRNKTVLWIDNGLFHGFARRVAPYFGKNYYWSPWANGFPSQKQTRLGEGFPELQRMNDPQRHEDEIDLFVFLDLFQTDWQARLRKQGYRVWGAGDGEAIEVDREGFRKWCERKGLPQTPAEYANGTDELRRKLANYDDAFVKLADGRNRGDMETWNWKGKHLSTPRLDQEVYELGSFKEDTRFIIEKKMKNVIELGEDACVVDDQWPDHVMQGMEVKGMGTVGIIKPYKELPKAQLDFNAKLSPVLKADKARTLFCMEGLYTESRKYFPMDPCMRPGSPSNELMASLFTPESWARTLWDGAAGIMTSPVPCAKYGIVAMAYNENSGKNWQPLSYPKEADKWVFLRNPYALRGKRYAVPQGSPTNLAGVVGTGKTLLEAATALGEHAKMIDGNQLEIATDSLLKMLDIIQTSNKWGATFTTDPLPNVEELKKAIG